MASWGMDARKGPFAIIGLIAVAGITGLTLFLDHERTRDLEQWRTRLDSAADNASRGVSGWVNNQFRELTNLADNAALQIYFTQMQMAGDQADPAQGEYLKNLLNLNAQRIGFEADSATATRQLEANMRALGSGGIALVKNDGTLVMASAQMPAMEGALAERIRNAPKGEAGFLDLTHADNQRIGFIVPVYGVQSDRSATSQMGMLVGVRPLNADVLAMLAPAGKTEKTLDIALVRAEGDKARYLTPLHDNSPLMSRTETAGDASAASFGLTHPDHFAERTDYTGQPVLVTGRAIPSTPWAVIAKIDRDEALASTIAWRNTVSATIIALLLALSAGVLAVWRNVAARHQKALAVESGTRAQLLAENLHEREMRVNTLNQLVGMLVSLIDKRDPNAAEHSVRVATMAAGTARAMGLDETMVETTTTAARLMNIGKVGVPPELLTRNGALNDAERDVIRNSLATSASLLKDIAFTGPVAETLQQAQEHVDGNGPMQRKGEDILVSARIIAAANALVGMTSPRAYRPAMPWQEATALLQAEADTRYDRKVLSALMHYLDNQGGREACAAKQPAGAKTAW